MKRKRAGWFLSFLVVTALWQGVYCRKRARGDWSALFFTGELMPRPPDLRAGYVYPHSTGYDGQMYRLVAHDPLLRHGYGRFLDDTRLRYQRILVPGFAALLGGRSPEAVDFWYIAIVDLLLACGGVWFLVLADGLGPPWLAAVIYLLIPAVVASTDRMLVDGPMLAVTLGAWIYFGERRLGPLLFCLAALPLIRETGICITVGVAAAFLAQHRFREMWWTGLSTAPFLGWAWFLARRTPPSPETSQIAVPLWPQIARLFTPFPRPAPPPWDLILESLDQIAVLCLLLTFLGVAVVAAGEWQSGGLKPQTWLVLPMAAAAMFFSGPRLLADSYGFMRYISVVMAWLELRLLPARPRLALAYVTVSVLALLVYRGAIVMSLPGR